MSTHEIHDLIFQKGIFTFNDGHQNTVMIVARYNIVQARIEYYLIPESNIIAYQAARSKFDSNTHRELGTMVDIEHIVNAKLAA